MNLKEQIIKANQAYRSGSPIIDDQEYDLLLSKLEKEMDFISLEEFKQSLTETSGDFQHDYVIGSLNKVKYGEGDLQKWLKKQNASRYIASEKLDGCSFVAYYKKGLFVSMSSRGDGSEGTDWTDKGKFILPKIISYKGDLDIRGELILNNHETLGMKNRRNGISGLMGRDDFNPDDLKNITPYVYQVLNYDWTMLKQFEFLNDNSFKTPDYKIFSNVDTLEEDLLEFYNECKEENIEKYDIDGLVVSSMNWKNENNEFYPKGKIAFKVNSEGYETEVIDIEWNLSQGGLLKPVVLVKPVEIDGVTVSRVSGNNYEWITNRGIGIGAKIKIIRSGAVIPKIIDVIEKSCEILVPPKCPSCGSKLNFKGVDLACLNPNCLAVVVQRISAFLRNCGVEDVTEKSLVKFGINTFEDLISWEPDPKYKSQTKFYDAMNKFVFSKTSMELFSKFVFDGAGEKTITKIYEHFKVTNEEQLDWLLYKKELTDHIIACCTIGFPEGIGERTLSKIAQDWNTNKLLLKYFTMDKRWNPKEVVKDEVVEDVFHGKNFCITGTLSQPRKHFENLIESKGGKLGSVSKNLNYLLVGSDAGSKLDKAQKLGIKILSEEEFLKMI